MHEPTVPVPRILTPRDYRVMPWKNGGGTTTEIHIHPEGAGWDTFDWRVGIADIARSGPFSSFPGIDRSIMLLDCPAGSGMRLTIDDREVDLPLHRFIDFAGEATTHGALLGAPVRDFNVMSRRERVGHRCGFHALDAGRVFIADDAESTFAYVATGEAAIGGGAPTGLLRPGDSCISHGRRTAFVAGDSGCTLVWASFTGVVPMPRVR